MADFYCKHCGAASSSISGLTANYCSKHPYVPNKGMHMLYEGGEKAEYTCKNCGASASSIAGITAHCCSKHPKGENKGKHQPAM